jgi:anti-sigma B factor antagonist
MEITQSRQGAVQVIALKGRIVIGESAAALKQVLQTALAEKSSEGVTLDMAQVDYLDSTGLGDLVGHLTLFKDAGKRLVLRSPAPRIMALIRLAKLDAYLPIENPPVAD